MIDTGVCNFKGKYFTMEDCRVSPRANNVKFICAGSSDAGLAFTAQYADYSFALGKGTNQLTFRAGPAEGTVTVEGSTNRASKGKQLLYSDFHPEVVGFGEPNLFIGPAGKGSITFPVTTPGDMVRLRFGSHYRARDAKDGLDYDVSFDGGKTWKTVDRAAGPTPGDCKYVVVSAVPAGTRQALVRFAGTSRNATGIFNFRIDADYREPRGGFRPV